MPEPASSSVNAHIQIGKLETHRSQNASLLTLKGVQARRSAQWRPPSTAITALGNFNRRPRATALVTMTYQGVRGAVQGTVQGFLPILTSTRGVRSQREAHRRATILP